MGKHDPPNANQVTTQDGQGKPGTVQGELDDVQQDLSGVHTSVTALQDALKPLATSRINDPHFQDIFDTDLVPNPSGQTGDPHRLTFRLPNSDHTVFSLGAAGDHDRIADPGIRGRTDHHIHFEVAPAKGDAEQKTLVSLGAPPQDVTITSHDAKVPKKATGFTALTDGVSWLESNKQFYILSRTKDVVVRSMALNVLVQADVGSVDIVGGSHATVGSKSSSALIADGGVEIEDEKYDEDHKAVHVDYWFSSLAKSALQARDVWVSGEALWNTYQKVGKGPKPTEPGWKDSSTNVVKMLLDGAKIISTVVREADAWLAKAHWANTGAPTAAVKSSGYTSVAGDFSGSLYGGLSASVTSLLSASVLGASASLKGMLYASVWGWKEASVKAKKDLKLEAEQGQGSLKSKDTMYVASIEKTVIVQGQLDVRLNSVAGAAFVHGNTKAFCIGGDGPGYGIGAHKDGVHLGKFNSPKTFPDPKFEANEGFWVTKSGLGGKFKSAKFQFTDSDFRAEGKKVEIKGSSGNAVLDGSKVLIG